MCRGTFAFEISNYSCLQKGLGSGKFIRSAAFSIGGYDWCVRYYPNGYVEEGGGWACVQLELITMNVVVRAQVEFLLVDQSIKNILNFTMDGPRVLNTIEAGKNVLCNGIPCRNSLVQPPSQYLRDDCLWFHCNVIVTTVQQVAEETLASPKIRVPPSLLDNLGKLLETGEGADVTFKVQGVAFPAHKIILTMQSPVFKAQLYGPMVGNTNGQEGITVQDMEPDVFKAMLTYIYTDSLQSMDHLQGRDKEEMVKHLLVAAIRYGMERMKFKCESVLGESLDVERVAATLALADQYHCDRLKDACMEFITSSNRMDDVMATQGYKDLKRSCPTMLVDVLERAIKSRKI